MYVGLLKKIPLLTILNTKVPNPGPAPDGTKHWYACSGFGLANIPSSDYVLRLP